MNFNLPIPELSVGYLRRLVAKLKSIFNALDKYKADRINGIIKTESYSSSVIPSAADYEGGITYISDENLPTYSDGAQWCRLVSSYTPVIADGTKPLLSIGNLAFGSLPNNYVYIRQDTSDRASAVTLRSDRIVDEDNGGSSGRAIWGYTIVQVDTAQTEWAILGQLENYSDTSSNGNVAVSGVANKYGAAKVFGGHFQGKEWVIESVDTDVKPLLGIEVNCPAIGLDHPTANNGLGNRFVIDVIARTNESITDWDTAGGNDGDAEIGAGIRIRSDATTDGYFRYGLVIDDVSQTGNPNPITTGALIQTGGADGLQVKGENTSAGIRIDPDTPGAYGLVIEGSYSSAAMRVDTDQWIELSTDGLNRVRYRAANDSIVFNDSTNQRFQFEMSASPYMSISGTQVVSARKTGWTDQTATASRADLGSSPTTAQLASFCRALYDDLKSHGLIGN